MARHLTFVRRPKHVTAASLNEMLEGDAGAVEDLKREMETFEEKELESSQEYLASLRKTYDKLMSEVPTIIISLDCPYVDQAGIGKSQRGSTQGSSG